MLTILVSFLYPTVLVDRRARAYRDAILEDLRQEYVMLERELAAAETAELDAVNERLEFQQLRTKYEAYDGVSLYPL